METTDSDKHWYVVLTRTNSERKVRDYFQLQEVDTFLPVQNRVIEREGKRIERERLLLPRMVFVHISRQEMAAVRSTLNVYDFLRDRSPGLLPVSLMRKWLIFAICSITPRIR